jgi:hypothetical protein
VPPFFCAAAGLAASAVQNSIVSAADNLPGKLQVRIQPPNVFSFSVELH